MRVQRAMIMSLLLGLLWLSACSKSEERRKIRLASEEERQGREASTREATTLRFEPSEKKTIAVMYFANKTGDASLEWLQRGLTEMLVTDLSQSRYLEALSPQRLFETLQRYGKQVKEPLEFKVVAAVAKEADVEAILVGSYTKEGDSLQIEAQLHEAGSGRLLQSEAVRGKGMEKLFSMVDELTRKVRGDLKLSLQERGEVDRSLADVTTRSVEAYRHYVRGVEHLDKFFFQEAALNLEKAIQLDSTFASAYARLADSYSGLGRVDLAVSALEKASKFSDRATEKEKLSIAAQYAAVRGDLVKLMEARQRLVELYPYDAEARYRLASVYWALRQFDRAIADYQRAIEIDPKYKLAYNQLAYAYSSIGRHGDAIATLQRYADLAPDEPNPWDSLGEIHEFAGDFDKAIGYYRKALSIKSDFHLTLEHLGRASLSKGDYQAAVKYYQQCLERAPSDELKSRGHTYLSEAYWAMGKLDKAKREAEKGLELLPSNYFLALSLGKLCKMLGETDSTHQCYEHWYQAARKKLLSRQPDIREVMSFSWFALETNLHLDDLIQLLEEQIKRAPSPLYRSALSAYLSVAYGRKGWIEKAREAFQEASFSRISQATGLPDPGWSYAWKFIGPACQNPAWVNRAEVQSWQKVVRSAEEGNNRSYEAAMRYMLALCNETIGDMGKARKEYAALGAPQESDWLVIGPFENIDGFNREFLPEREVNLRGSYSAFGKAVRWMPFRDRVPDGFINLRDAFRPHVWTVAYALTSVDSPSKRSVQLRVGSDDGVKIWVNDRLVWRQNRIRLASIDNDIVPVELEKGANKILVKVTQNTYDWGFYFRITDKSGKGMGDLRFRLPSEGKLAMLSRGR